MDRQLDILFEDHFKTPATEAVPLKVSGSNRHYYRLSSGSVSAIGVEGTDIDENRAFITLAGHFREKGINVPEIYGVSQDGQCYLQQDLGDESLYDKVRAGRESGSYSDAEVELLCGAIRELPRIQFIGAQDIDYSICYPDREFNARMVDFDLSYFKYCFLKTSGIRFNEIRLQDDFDAFKDNLLESFGGTFMYRDFQARNIMYHDGGYWFIDFQGGRRGPVFYDIASFVWQAGSHFPVQVKERLVAAYLEGLKQFASINRKVFNSRLRTFALFRTLQVLGAYGFRGRFERKPHFLNSIPYAIDNLKELILEPMPEYPYLREVLDDLVKAETGKLDTGDEVLTVEITSFSYKNGLPEDKSGHGGGYIFDCRALNNPGRYDEYKELCGRDDAVITFLDAQDGVTDFLENAYSLVDRHVEMFLLRGFSHIQVDFGCTGGRHRSVYCAEHMAEHIRQKFNIRVIICHRELGIRETLR